MTSFPGDHQGGRHPAPHLGHVRIRAQDRGIDEEDQGGSGRVGGEAEPQRAPVVKEGARVGEEAEGTAQGDRDGRRRG